MSVYGTVPPSLALGSVSRHHDYVRFASTFSPLAFGSPGEVDLPASRHAARRLDRDNRRPAGFRLMRPAIETWGSIGL